MGITLRIGVYMCSVARALRAYMLKHACKDCTQTMLENLGQGPPYSWWQGVQWMVTLHPHQRDPFHHAHLISRMPLSTDPIDTLHKTLIKGLQRVARATCELTFEAESAAYNGWTFSTAQVGYTGAGYLSWNGASSTSLSYFSTSLSVVEKILLE
jgi:hypothetical protein